MLVFMPAIDREYMQTVINSGKSSGKKNSCQNDESDIEPDSDSGTGADAGVFITKKIPSGVENVLKRKHENKKTVLKEVKEKKPRLNTVTPNKSDCNTRSGKPQKNTLKGERNSNRVAKSGPLVKSKRSRCNAVGSRR